MKCILTIGLMLCFLSFYSPLEAQDSSYVPQKKIQLHGYLKDIPSVSFGAPGQEPIFSNIVHQRFNFKWKANDHLTARLEIRNRIFVGEPYDSDFGSFLDQNQAGMVKFSKLWLSQNHLVIHSIVDRLVVGYTWKNWDIKIGRQRINWGVANIWNPNDLFNAYNFLDFDYEERPGSDGIRLSHYGGNNTSWEIAYARGKNVDEQVAALLYKFNQNGYDMQILGGLFHRELVAGGGWAGSIKNLGFKGEISYFHPQKNLMDTAGVLSVSVMLDYTFKKNWYGNLSFLVNDASGTWFSSNWNLIALSFNARNLFPFPYSFYIGATKSFSPVATMQIAMIYGTAQHSLIIFPAFSLNVSHNFDLDVMAQSFFANIANHYQSQGTTLFLRSRLSF